MYKPSRLVTAFPIAGFKYHDGALVLDKLSAGKKIKLVPEPDNPYDPGAIQLRYKGTKLGYVPRDENGLMALMAYFGHRDVFEARVLKVDPEAEPRDQVRVGIYVTDKR